MSDTPTPKTDAAQSECAKITTSDGDPYLAWYGYISEHARQLERENAELREDFARKLERKNSDLREVLEEALEFAADREDVDDGPEGRPRPNAAMKLAISLRAALAKPEARP